MAAEYEEAGDSLTGTIVQLNGIPGWGWGSFWLAREISRAPGGSSRGGAVVFSDASKPLEGGRARCRLRFDAGQVVRSRARAIAEWVEVRMSARSSHLVLVSVGRPTTCCGTAGS